jgi:hypothetical protein
MERGTGYMAHRGLVAFSGLFLLLLIIRAWRGQRASQPC